MIALEGDRFLPWLQCYSVFDHLAAEISTGEGDGRDEIIAG